MNRRFYCVVGVASGLVLLGGGVAQARATPDEADRNIDLSADAGAGRTELLSGLGGLGGGGGGGNGAGGALLGLLGGLPGGSLLGKLTTDGGPLGQLFGDGPLGNLLAGPQKAPANNSGQIGPVTGNSPRFQVPAAAGDDLSSRRLVGPVGEEPIDATGTHMADPAMSGVAANAPRRSDYDAATPGDAAGETPAHGDAAAETPGHSALSGGDGLVTTESALGANPLAGGILGPYGPLHRVDILGGESLTGLPIVGDLLGGGLSLDTLGIPAITGVANQIKGQGDGKASPLGHLGTVGNLSRMLLGGEPASERTEAANTQHAIDKTKVTPELLPLFGPDALGTQELGGIIYQLPSAG